MSDNPKRGRGRPSIADEPGERFEIRLPATVAEQLRALGQLGTKKSLSRGILRMFRGESPFSVHARAKPERPRKRLVKSREVGSTQEGGQ